MFESSDIARLLNDMQESVSFIQGYKPDSSARVVQGSLSAHPQTAAIVLAGGVGERFRAAGGKQLVQLGGKPVLTWACESFDAVGDVGKIIIVCPEHRQAEYKKRAIDPYSFVTPIVFAPAGETRQESAFSGLEYVDDDFEFVVLHDGARPLIMPSTIAHTISTVKGNIDVDGAVVAYPAIDTLKIVERGFIVGTPDRSVIWNAQTPQVFRTGVYRRAHCAALAEGFIGTDDASLIERLGGRILVVEGSRDNIKLTVPEDYQLLCAAMSTMFRSTCDSAKQCDNAAEGGSDAERDSAGERGSAGERDSVGECDSAEERGSAEECGSAGERGSAVTSNCSATATFHATSNSFATSNNVGESLKNAGEHHYE